MTKFIIYSFLTMMLNSLCAFAQNEAAWDESASRKATAIYDNYLLSYMRSPAFNPHNLTFRINNDYSTRDQHEFYMMAVLHREWMYVTYPEKKSIYRQLHDTFASDPSMNFYNYEFKPNIVKKKIRYSDCKNLHPLVYEVENTLKSSTFSNNRYKDNDKNYLIGYRNNSIELTYRTDSDNFPAVKKLLKIKKIALKCAKELPTVEEEKKLAEEKRRREYKGKLYNSPPNIVAYHGEISQPSKIGSFCWPIDTVSLCSDSFSWPTQSKPIKIKKNEALTFKYPEKGKIKLIEYQLTRVSAKDRATDINIPDTTYWNIPVETVKVLQPNEYESLKINVKPGLYVLTIFGWWKGIGDSTHGFLIEVSR